MFLNPDRRRRSVVLARIMICLTLIALLILSSACQTPPKKTNKSASNRNSSQNQGVAASKNAFDLFSASAELFGTDPRLARPVLVSDTVFAVVVGAAVLLALIILVSAIRAGRTTRPRRRAKAA